MSTLKFAPDTIETIAITDLRPYERNPRTHSARQVSQIAASMREFGWTVPVLIDDDNEIIGGHGRLLAAKEMGIPSVPAIRLKHLTPEQVQGLRIADNQLTVLGDWNLDLLSVETQDLGANGFDLDLLGFDHAMLARLLATNSTALTDPDDVPDVPTNAVSRRGDLWILGSHRLLCEDSTNASAVTKITNGTALDMILTDPPYCSGGFQEAGKRSGSIGTRGTEMIAADTLSTHGYLALIKSMLSNIGVGVIYIFTDWRMWVNLFDSVESSGFGVRNMIVWDKGTPGMGAGWRMQHELVMCAIRVKSPFNPKKAQGNVIQSKRTGNKLHATEKPVDLLCSIIDVTDMAQTIYDPFVGSGTTIIAAQMTGRICYAMEIAQSYTDVAVRRWQAFTGQSATLDGDGRTFDEITSERSTMKCTT